MKDTQNKFTEKEVLRLASILVENASTDYYIIDCEIPFCPWCAIAKAKGILDEVFDCEIPDVEAIIYFDTELGSDLPLVNARKALFPWNSIVKNTITKEISLKILEVSLNKLGKKEKAYEKY